MLELLESLGVEEVSQCRKRSSRALRELLLSIANQIKEDLLTKIKASPFFGILTDEVTDITNIQNLVTFIKYLEKHVHHSFIRVTHSTFPKLIQPIPKLFMTV